MPDYSYQCKEGHITNHWCKPSDMPDEVTCSKMDCGKKAKWTPTPNPNGGVRINNVKDGIYQAKGTYKHGK